MSRIDVNDKRWPLVVVGFPLEFSDDDVRRYVDDLEERIGRHAGPFVLLVDTSRGRLMSPRQRRLQATYMADVEKRGPRRIRAIAFVVVDAITRGALTAIFWLTRPSYPTRVFDKQADAEIWLIEQFNAPCPI